MRIRYNIPKLQQIIHDLATLTQISISFLNTDRVCLCNQAKPCDFCRTIQEDPSTLRLCAASDAEILERCTQSRCFEDHLCHAGLHDAAIPIVKQGLIVGYTVMGRIRSAGSPQHAPEPYSIHETLYREIPFFSDEQIDSLRSLLQDILFESAIELDTDDSIDEIATYIQEHLNEALNIRELCDRFYVSRNYLYKGIKQYYGVTVGEYISAARLEKAKQLLMTTKLPIRVICERVGIDNYTYFCRWFRKSTGQSPTEYRHSCV